ncbi:RNA 3'-terminal phosphate cyclase [Heterostelium album PN500]|uniref:RNA 3'-terminal-phosphate cyclase (ATP) n=1 Tax=Heterostelium pallidum (strain ATCC 26659 / Pp 5 / PN500) TaxID=670386 RepID=D3BAC3_HETP5|nr:RNA 3'-terminal phosphate cyclase [Heterostelium album PN500]EFA81510.1 RNA 3'-terminal phosphate cyclase [Heterostelium album PN500]|eukprot:XP_020433627.1 RNA 3'-terminal phosphate cyclase [Heterostelium album PN500]
MTKTKRNFKPHNKKTKVPQAPATSSTNSKDDSSLPEVEVNPSFVLDGSILEGGGQILRNSIALSSLLSKPVRIEKIRYNRDQPGLKAQHKAGVDLVSRMFKAHTDGVKQGSTVLYYHPRISTTNIKDQSIEADTGTAGSITLLIQIALPCLLFTPKSTKLDLGGGTNVDFSPAADYLMNVFFPIAKQFGINSNMEVLKRGYYPRGGGKVSLITQPIKGTLNPISILKKGNLVKFTIRVFFTSTRISAEVGDRMLNAARKMIKKDYKKVEIVEELVDTAKYTFGDGCCIFITAETDTGCLYGGSANGAIGVPAEKVGEDAATSILNDLLHGGCMDEYLQDQLIIFMALAKGTSQIKTGPISLHTETSIHFTSLLTGAKFQVKPAEDKQRGEDTFIITCEGVGFENKSSETKSDEEITEQNGNDDNTSTTTTTTTSSSS